MIDGIAEKFKKYLRDTFGEKPAYTENDMVTAFEVGRGVQANLVKMEINKIMGVENDKNNNRMR